MKKLTAAVVLLVSLNCIEFSNANAADDAADCYAKAEFYQYNGFYRRAGKYYEHAIKLEPKNRTYRNGYAWFLATARDPSVRDGKKAIDHATEALFQAKGIWVPGYQDTLAACYARAGIPALAVIYQRKALAGFNQNEEFKKYWKEEIPNARDRLKAYLDNQAWTEDSNKTTMFPLEPIAIPRSLFNTRKRDIERIVSHEEGKLMHVLATIFLLYHTDRPLPNSFKKQSTKLVAPIEYKVVSDNDYEKNELAGHKFVIMMAISNHKELVKQLNETTNFSGESRAALLAEMAVGVSKKRSQELEKLFRLDVSPETQQFVRTVWKILDVVIEEEMRKEFRKEKN